MEWRTRLYVAVAAMFGVAWVRSCMDVGVGVGMTTFNYMRAGMSDEFLKKELEFNVGGDFSNANTWAKYLGTIVKVSVFGDTDFYGSGIKVAYLRNWEYRNCHGIPETGSVALDVAGAIISIPWLVLYIAVFMILAYVPPLVVTYLGLILARRSEVFLRIAFLATLFFLILNMFFMGYIFIKYDPSGCHPREE